MIEEIDLFSILEPSTQIGKVRFNDESSCIFLDVYENDNEYEIDLERCRTAEQALGWIMQVKSKTWGDEVMPDFIKMLCSVIPKNLWAGKI